MSYTKIDLHVHSSHSKNADNTLLKAIGVNECYTLPKQVYKRALARGMDWVTITDHDTITGALEIAHLPNAFISEEITTYFPEDHGKIHVVALHIDEAQHAEIQRLRSNVYELVSYLNSEQITHFLAHPFFGMSTIITMQHIEKMMLLFKNIEVKNGGKQLFTDTLLQDLLANLTEKQILQFVDRHHIEPIGEHPWIKNQIGGSDDHGGILIGCPHTIIPKAHTAKDIVTAINNGESRVGGYGGTYQSVSHQILSVVHGFASHRLKKASLKTKVSLVAGNLLFGGKIANRLQALPMEMMLDLFSIHEMETLHFSNILRNQIKKDKTLSSFLSGKKAFNHENNQKFFNSISAIADKTFSQSFSEKFSDVPIAKKIKTIFSVVPLLLPYFISCKTEYSDRKLMAEACDALLPAGQVKYKNTAIFTDKPKSDALTDFNFQYILFAEQEKANDLHYFTLAEHPQQHSSDFAALSLIQNDERLLFPPLLQVLERFINSNITKIYVHSFGPMGLLGLLLGKLVQIPVSCRCSAAETNAILQKLKKYPKYKLMVNKIFKQIFNAMHQVHIVELSDAAFAQQLGLENLVNHVETRSDKSRFRSIADTF